MLTAPLCLPGADGRVLACLLFFNDVLKPRVRWEGWREERGGGSRFNLMFSPLHSFVAQLAPVRVRVLRVCLLCTGSDFPTFRNGSGWRRL